MAPIDHRYDITFLLNGNEYARQNVPRLSTITRDIMASDLAKCRRHKLDQQNRPASREEALIMKPGANIQPRHQHRNSPRGVPTPVLGVTKHRETCQGLVELYVHYLLTLPNGQRIVHGRWEQERIAQLRHENAVLAYWSGLGSRIIALGSRHTYQPLRILKRGADNLCLVQWIGYPPSLPYATHLDMPILAELIYSMKGALGRRCIATLSFEDDNLFQLSYSFDSLPCPERQVNSFHIPAKALNGDAYITWYHSLYVRSAADKRYARDYDKIFDDYDIPSRRLDQGQDQCPRVHGHSYPLEVPSYRKPVIGSRVFREYESGDVHPCGDKGRRHILGLHGTIGQLGAESYYRPPRTNSATRICSDRYPERYELQQEGPLDRGFVYFTVAYLIHMSILRYVCVMPTSGHDVISHSKTSIG
ncbi:hypothetical protein NPX13_g2470 [Xylaria arbuscula]|uniref:Uncharacterized protein n=1 Tax=Xylaria arbuscula TaxID=114810 RepID=A0A9W8NJ39_9PEZI|nr:hypothetical protein NPX13_g2470 [Xylaria arbuscula]